MDGDHRRGSRRTTSRAPIREDIKRAKLLYLGTEHGVYVSFDDGAHWQSLQQNLPDTPVHDLAWRTARSRHRDDGRGST
jgi:hypothetical protein